MVSHAVRVYLMRVSNNVRMNRAAGEKANNWSFIILHRNNLFAQRTVCRT